MARAPEDPRTRGPCNFRQRDMMAAVKAVKAAGCDVQRVEVDKSGKIVVIMGAPLPAPVEAPDQIEPERNEWDE